VLHIDDEREPLWMTKKLLEMADAGLKVESVSSPVEALEMLREGGFDCVVTDFKMSPMDGIEVSDTGEGVRVEALEDLFKAFHSSKPGGMGLGLAYCKRAVEAHGGRIDVESEVGGGTTFMVLLSVA
jgi:signal transduction histidine kinase